MSDELPKALVLRLNSRMAIILQMLVHSAGCRIAGKFDTADVLTHTMQRLQDEYPEDFQQIKDSLVSMVEAVPEHIVASMGLQVLSSHELDAAVARHKQS